MCRLHLMLKKELNMFSKRKFMCVSCAFLAFSIAAVAPSVATATPEKEPKVKLRFKPTGSKPLKLTVQRKTDIYKTSWEREREHSLYKGTNVFSYQVKKDSDDLLRIKAKLYSSDKNVNGKTLQEGETKERVSSDFKIDSTGKRATNSKGVNLSSELDLVFPERALGTGDTWKVTVPPSDNFPAPIDMHFEIDKFVEKGSATFCVINVTYNTSALFTERGCRAKIESKNRIIFNVSKGHIMRQTGSSTFITTWLKEGLDNPFQSASFASMKLTIQ